LCFFRDFAQAEKKRRNGVIYEIYKSENMENRRRNGGMIN
jgi:hypothetical protein